MIDETRTDASIYVYYRLRADVSSETACARIATMQQAVTERTPVTARLMRRLEDTTTWMEIYEHVTNVREFEAVLAEEVAVARLDDLIEPGSARHIEHFVAIGRPGEAD
ncbi:MAG TPA: DUF4936 family protein [Azoarcus taiwanensis]|uniref:DUF4936 family protein n=1 Tax=Azoarcus taiwanensis TaxID=666964 RepID=A0A972F6S1_9RHOO|nr:DUF4936 family protein [Azoarcus taiwanensis]NMG02075.1 DUF4936 family protein [Azoarcus taiwanensis]HRQ57986.1 DUF4936 family protein [Azoarcus taiwanensis]